MQMPDVNVLLYASREEFPEHERYARWLEELATGKEPFALSETVMQGYVRAGDQHWRIFRHLCVEKNVRGTLVSDAAHAALAIESGCEWISADTDFARFAPPLRWRYL